MSHIAARHFAPLCGQFGISMSRRCAIRGSIPACAGEPAEALYHQDIHRVYPRVCGGTSDLPLLPYTPTVYPRVCGGTSLSAASVRSS